MRRHDLPLISVQVKWNQNLPDRLGIRQYQLLSAPIVEKQFGKFLIALFPICSYGITKLTIEKYLALFNHLYDLDYTVLRIGNAYGDGQRTESVQGAVGVFLGKALKCGNALTC